MTIRAEVILDSTSPAGIRLVTMQLRYPNFIHGELLTHRVFSRNASSSRAVPVSRLIRDVEEDPVVPMGLGRNQPGMQAGEELDTDTYARVMSVWIGSIQNALEYARRLDELGVHKQHVNRLLEPFSYINVLVTSTEWSNFFALRRHPDAMPEMRELADQMWRAQKESTSQELGCGEWHLPYISTSDLDWGDQEKVLVCIKRSVARCARVSYLTHEMRTPNVDEDLTLYKRLVGGHPLHASPAEHQACPDMRLDTRAGTQEGYWAHQELHGNLRGWVQFRKMLAGENIQEYRPEH